MAVCTKNSYTSCWRAREQTYFKWKSLYLKYIRMIQNKPLPPFKKRVIMVNESCKQTFQYLESKQWNQ